MKTTQIISSLIIALALPLLHSCQKSTIDLVEPTQGEESSSTYKLEKPLTVSFLVGPNKQIRPMGAVTRAVGDLSRDYTQDDKDNATVNSHQPTSYDRLDPHLSIYYDTNLALYRSDWIRNIYIPELSPSDYKVEGVVPIPGDDLSNVDTDVSEDQVPAKVTITFYSLPKGEGKVLTFLVNARLYDSVYKSSYPEQYMDLTESYFLATSPLYRLSSQLNSDNDKYLGGWAAGSYQDAYSVSSSLFEAAYIPMYARLYNVTVSESKDALVASEIPTATPEITRSIYLERAVSLVTIAWDKPQDVSKDFDYVVEEVYFGKLPNAGSIIPNNWAGVQKIMSERMGDLQPVGQLQKTLPSFWDNRRNHSLRHGGGGVTQDGYVLREKDGTVYFFTPENLSEKQSTIYVVLRQFDPTTGKAIQTNGTKVFELPYGEKNTETGLLEVHRNTWYNLHIKLKQTPSGPVPYIVETWSNQDVDLPW